MPKQVLRTNGLVDMGEAYFSAVPYALGWAQETVTRGWFVKLMAGIYAAFVAEVTANIAKPLVLALSFWALDYLAGIFRAAADPDTPWELSKLARGAIKPMVIVVLTLAASAMEVLTSLLLGYHPQGKFVVLVAAAIAIEEAFSIRDHGAFFFRRVHGAFKVPFRFTGGAEDDDA